MKYAIAILVLLFSTQAFGGAPDSTGLALTNRCTEVYLCKDQTANGLCTDDGSAYAADDTEVLAIRPTESYYAWTAHLIGTASATLVNHAGPVFVSATSETIPSVTLTTGARAASWSGLFSNVAVSLAGISGSVDVVVRACPLAL